MELISGRVQLCAGSEGLGVLQSCTSMTRIVLQGSTLMDGTAEGGSAAAVAAAGADLKRLELITCSLRADLEQQQQPDGVSNDQQIVKALRDTLAPHLTSLTALQVNGGTASLQSCFTRHVSTIASLQELSLAHTGPITTAALPDLERLTALEDLSLSNCDVEPCCLLPMATCLTRLRLGYVALQPSQAQQDSASGASQLLQLLAQLRALQVLGLTDIDCEWPQQQLAQYSALTASSSLGELCIIDCDIQGAAWAHVFPAGRQLPQLHSFSARQDFGNDLCCLGSTGISHLVSCCPALKQLQLQRQPDASLSPLQSLAALTQLTIGPVSPAVICSDLAALSQLQSLGVALSLPAEPATPPGHPWQHLLPLTALTGLTRLICDASDLPLLCLPKAWPLRQAPAGSPSAVWVELLEQCATDPTAQPAVMSSMLQQPLQQHEQLGQQAALLQQQQQQQKQGAQQAALLQQHEQELAADRAEAAELRGQVQVLAAARAVAAAEAAELRGQVQALQAQLQEVQTALKQQRQD